MSSSAGVLPSYAYTRVSLCQCAPLRSALLHKFRCSARSIAHTLPHMSSHSLVTPVRQPATEQSSQPLVSSPTGVTDRGVHLLTASAAMKKVILDHDAHSDDLIVIMMLVHSPDVDLIGTAVCPADCYKDTGVRATRGVLTALGGDAVHIPVAAGDDEGQFLFPEEWRVDSIKLADLSGVEQSSEAEPAIPFITRLLEESQEPVTLVITGPATHLGAVLAARPDLVPKVERAWVMGGAVRVPGNVPGVRAEWNFRNHPKGAAQLVASGVPITLVALDATNHAPLTRNFLEKVRSPLARRIWDAVIHQVENDNNEQTYYFWDTLTAAAMLKPGLLVTERVKIVVLPDGETREDDSGHAVDLGVSVDVEALETLIIDLLSADRFGVVV